MGGSCCPRTCEKQERRKSRDVGGHLFGRKRRSRARSPVCPWRRLCSLSLRLTPLSPAAEHQNYFGIDENLGPVALSIRREKVEDAREREGSQFNYRVAFRTSEVKGRGGCPRPSRRRGALGCSG